MKSLVYVCIFDLTLCIIFPFVQTLVPIILVSIVPVCLNIAYLMLANSELQKRIFEGHDAGFLALNIYLISMVVATSVFIVWVFIQLCLFNYDDLYPYVAWQY